MKLSENFYSNGEVTEIARNLIGKILCTRINGKYATGIIVETEAYSFTERACHAYGNKKTKRTSVMYMAPGTSYVYLCYGIHNLLNIVTNKVGIAEAVLIRAIEPLDGKEMMLERRNMSRIAHALSDGPGKLTQALGITRSHNKLSLTGNEIWVEERDNLLTSSKIDVSPRIGVGYAGTDANLPWRFSLNDNQWVSKGNNTYYV